MFRCRSWSVLAVLRWTCYAGKHKKSDALVDSEGDGERRMLRGVMGGQVDRRGRGGGNLAISLLVIPDGDPGEPTSRESRALELVGSQRNTQVR